MAHRIVRLQPVWFNPDTGYVRLADPLPEERQAAECRAMERRYWYFVGEETNEPPFTHLIATSPSTGASAWPWWLAQVEEVPLDWAPLPLAEG